MTRFGIRGAVWSGLLVLALAAPVRADIPAKPGEYIREHYTKASVLIPMRDGTRLYTIIYMPKDRSQTYPMLMLRTPYSIRPYELDKFRENLGPNPHFITEKYIFVYQDVRGRYMSEGDFEHMRPQLAKKNGPKDIDESTDTYDTIEWLIKNVPNHNGKVGQYGISYPGFYTAAGMINAHPALKASSPQAPIADWFFDDFYHHGAFFLPHAFNFLSTNGRHRPKPTSAAPQVVKYGTPDGYQFLLDLGSLRNVNEKLFKNDVPFWNALAEHTTYDAFWKARNLLPHLKKVAPAVMTVGGWYDAEDLYGIFNTYQTVEKQNPGIFNVLVIGPWAHGGWSWSDSTALGDVYFGSNTSAFFQQHVELPFFNHHLKGKAEHGLPEALVFETARNRWRAYAHWPPRETVKKTLYLGPKGKLAKGAPEGDDGHDTFVSDPSKPVPYTDGISFGMDARYMTGDQRFASRRPDVLVYQTDVLADDMTMAGKLTAELFVSTTGTDSDWIVKLIDVYPGDAGKNPAQKDMGAYQQMVRSEVIRGRFRNSYSKPEAFEPNQPAKVNVELLDVLHTFKKGHKIMVQVHSTWFPLVDRNPQKYVPNIFQASENDFISATQRVFRSSARPSALHYGLLPNATP